MKFKFWAPTFLQAHLAEEPEVAVGERWLAENDVETLQSWAYHLENPQGHPQACSGKERYAALVLLRALRCSLLLRSRHRSLDAVHSACDLIYPGLTAELASEALRNKLPSATTLWRAQFHADLCLMEFERRLRRSSGQYFLYMWADSTPLKQVCPLVVALRNCATDCLAPVTSPGTLQLFPFLPLSFLCLPSHHRLSQL